MNHLEINYKFKKIHIYQCFLQIRFYGQLIYNNRNKINLINLFSDFFYICNISINL